MDLQPELESEHFDAQGRLARMGSYYRWILRNFGDAVGRRVWDAGAGIGTVSELLLERSEFLLSTEFGEKNLVALRARFGERAQVRVEYCDLSRRDALAFAADQLDTVVSLDVLEHLEDDVQALKLFREVLVPGGQVCIKVPAHPWLFGSMDRASLHFRRYSRAMLRSALEQAGLVVESLRPMNAPATLPYFLKGKLLRRDKNFSNTLDGGRLGFYDRVIPWIERVERVLPPPIGLSLIAVARRP
jgi:SAM-dependent methyltransferase